MYVILNYILTLTGMTFVIRMYVRGSDYILLFEA